MSTSEFASDPLGNTVIAWIRCQSHLILLVTKIVPGPCAHFSPPSAAPSPNASSALVSPWPESLLTKRHGCLELPAAQPGYWPLGLRWCQGRGRSHSLSYGAPGSVAQQLRARAQEPGCQRVQILAVLLVTLTKLVHLANFPICEGSRAGKWPD